MFLSIVLFLSGCDGVTGGPAATSSLAISIDGATARTYTNAGAAYLPNGSDGTNSPGVAGPATRIVAVNNTLTDMLFLDFIGSGAAGTFNAATSQIQVIFMIDGGPASGGRAFIIAGAGTGTVTVTAYGAVGGQVVGSFSLTAIEVDASMNPTGATPTLTGTFDLERAADQAANE